LRASRSFIDNPGDVVAIGGAIRLTNGCRIRGSDILEIAPPRQFLPLMQTLEYLRTFHLARTAMSAAGALTLISGAFGLFLKDVLFAVGGYAHDTVGEDYELGMRIHRHLRETGQKKAKIIYAPDAICWTQAPDTLSVLARQRTRWQRGAMETLWRHRDMIGNPRYGRIAALSLVEAVMTDIIAPIIEVLGYVIMPILILLGLLSLDYFIAFASVSIGLGIVSSVGAVLVEEMHFRRFPKVSHILLLLLAGVVENFGYRQLCGLWRIQGTWDYFSGKKAWGRMPRQRFSTP
jgi:cellulose synthase/poly-beta-1,6-N-acetylglucosamine synthase-like glycosyltransferase